MAAEKAQAATFLRKITSKEIGLLPKAMSEMVTAEDYNGKPIRVMRVYGMASGQKPGRSDNGEYIGFFGQFEAINLITGEKFRSKKLILGAIGEMTLSDALTRAQADNPEAQIEFGADITVQKKTNTKGGGWEHQWGFIPLLRPEYDGSNDALSKLGASLGDLPLLAGPQSTGKKGGKK